eukprot:3943998-Amphidinium_carterae.1
MSCPDLPSGCPSLTTAMTKLPITIKVGLKSKTSSGNSVVEDCFGAALERPHQPHVARLQKEDDVDARCARKGGSQSGFYSPNNKYYINNSKNDKN